MNLIFHFVKTKALLLNYSVKLFKEFNQYPNLTLKILIELLTCTTNDHIKGIFHPSNDYLYNIYSSHANVEFAKKSFFLTPPR